MPSSISLSSLESAFFDKTQQLPFWISLMSINPWTYNCVATVATQGHERRQFKNSLHIRWWKLCCYLLSCYFNYCNVCSLVQIFHLLIFLDPSIAYNNFLDFNRFSRRSMLFFKGPEQDSVKMKNSESVATKK